MRATLGQMQVPTADIAYILDKVRGNAVGSIVGIILGRVTPSVFWRSPSTCGTFTSTCVALCGW